MNRFLPVFMLLSGCAICGLLPFSVLNAQPNTPPITTDVTLCSVSFEVVTYNLYTAVTDAEGDSIVFSIAQLPSSGTLTLTASGTMTYVPQFTGFQEYFVYTACDSNGACNNGTVYINLAEIEEIPPITPTITNYTVEIGTSLNICEGNIGWAWQHNCIPDLYTVCVYHNDALGQITYVDDNCINYLPANLGTDTIMVIGCGDAPPPIFYTCNGWEQMNTCSHNYYVVNVVPNNSAFTETYNITCDSTLLVGQLGYPTWVTPSIITPPANGSAAILTDGVWSALQYIPNPNFNGTDTIVVACAHATQITCETGTYIINIDCTNGTGNILEIKNSMQVWYDTQAQNINIGFNTWQQDETAVSLYNTAGVLLYTSGNITPIDATSLPAGIYLLSVQNGNNLSTAKVVVAK